MPHTFEELATRELDGLYLGALFLSAGREPEAESLLMATLARAFRAFGSSDAGTNAGRWLEDRLVATHMTRAPDEVETGARTSSTPPEPDPSALAELDSGALGRAAGAVPHTARAAIWLVLLRRRSYEEAGRVLDLDREGLTELLSHRREFMAAVVRERKGRQARPGLSGS